MKLPKGAHLYFMGIGGTGMAAVAGLFKQAGFRVSGSDKGVYPPMSEMLEKLAIPYKVPYSKDNLIASNPDLIVVANALSRGNEEIEHMLSKGLAYTSFPALMGDQILASRKSVVVAGTHGKTTTTSLCAFVLDRLGFDPGFMIGGLPRDFEYSFRLGKGEFFVIEGDEYDTAFFDKGPKFVHYRPSYAIFNNLEFDHADIYQNLEQIAEQFTKLCQLVENRKNLIANADDTNVMNVLKKLGIAKDASLVSTRGQTPSADVVVKHFSASTDGWWQARFATQVFGEMNIKTRLSGEHNIANIAQLICLLGLFAQQKQKGYERLTPAAIGEAIAAFNGVKRRLDHLGTVQGIEVYEDFAHHPTAMRLVIQGFRKMAPNRRLIVAFEPANATGRRNVFQQDFAEALKEADIVYIGKCPVDTRIPEDQRMNTQAMAGQVGPKAKAFNENIDLLNHLSDSLTTGDTIIFMSPSSFSGIQHELIKRLKSKSS